MNELVLVRSRCRWCRAWYEREVEPEWIAVVTRFGICPPCYEAQEQARCMEVEDGRA